VGRKETAWLTHRTSTTYPTGPGGRFGCTSRAAGARGASGVQEPHLTRRRPRQQEIHQRRPPGAAGQRDLPPRYGDWKNTHRRFCRWRDAGGRERLPGRLVRDPDYEWPVIDATHVKVHRDGTGAKGDSQDVGRTKGGSAQRYT
jgi:hypothetical protein